jgi:hypothetical protein
MAGATTIALSAPGIDNQLTSGDYLQLLGGGTAAASLWALIGVGVGALVRNQVATLVGLCAWMLGSTAGAICRESPPIVDVMNETRR